MPTTTLSPVAQSRLVNRPISKSALLWHVMCHDLRHLWPHALLCLIAAGLAYFLGTHPASPEPGQYWQSIAVQLCVVPYWILLGSLLPAVIQSDSPLGSNGFLMTRPISSASLLAAKIIEASVLFVVVPVALHAAFLASQGFTGSQIGHACGNFATTLFVVLVWGLFFASVTRDYFQFWLLVVVLVVAANVFSAWLPSSPDTAPRDLQESRGQLGPIITTTGLFAVTVWHHRHRKPIRALVVAGLWVLVALQLTSYWPWTFPWTRGGSGAAEILTWPHQVVKGPTFLNDHLNHTKLLLTVELAPPPGEVVRIDEVDARVGWPTKTGRVETLAEIEAPAVLGARAAVQAMLGEHFNVTVSSDSLDRRVNIVIGPQPRDNRTASDFRGKLLGQRASLTFLGKVPFRPGETLSKEGHKVVVQKVPEPGGDTRLTLWYRGPRHVTSRSLDDLHFVLVNASRKEAHVLRGPTYDTNSSPLVPSVVVRFATWILGPGHDTTSANILTPEWLAAAELAIFVEEPGRSVSIDLSCSVPTDYFPQNLSPSERETAREKLEEEMRARIHRPDSSAASAEPSKESKPN